jgi:hypothetical protein
LNARAICGLSHYTAEGINLPNEVTFTNTPNRRIAGHLAKRINCVRNEQRTHTQPGGRQRSLSASMAAANHNDIVMFGMSHHCSNEN